MERKRLIRTPAGRVHSVSEQAYNILIRYSGWTGVFERTISTDRLMRDNRSVCG